MEREILFKAKRKDNGEWIESLTLLKLNEHLYMLQTAWGEITYDLQHNITAIFGRKKPFLVEVIPETVGRYTGLNDKNGRRIFEGDVLKRGDYKYVVEWCDDCAMFVLPCITDERRESDFTIFYGYDFEVIGNVYDNPELLKGET